MASHVLIDTSAWLFNFPPRTVVPIRVRIADLIERNLAAISSPILFELLSGTRSPEERDRLHRYLSGLHQFPFATGQWVQAAQWAFTLRSQGVQAKTVDLLIAYQAIAHRLTLLHADHDFDRIAAHSPLKVESHVQAVRSWSPD